MELNRSMGILMVLLRENKVTAPDLARRFEVSISTIYRDIDRLSGMGVPITCFRGRNGGVSIMEGYKLDKGFLDNSDIQNIIHSLATSEKISHNPNINSIINKLTFISPEYINTLLHDIQEYYFVDLDYNVQLEDPIYKAIIFSVDENYMLSIDYLGKTLTICPISFVLKNDGMYLYAFSEDYILIKIEEISSANTTEEEFDRNFIPYLEYKKIK